jgi:outer membrane protein TolC
MVGGGASMVFSVTDALFKPLADRQVVSARRADLQAVQNDSVLAVAEAYVNVQQARGELAGALDAQKRAEEFVRRTSKLAQGLVAPVDEVRARTELARRKQAVAAARERWQTASADLAQLLRLDAAALVNPLEPPHLKVTLVPLEQSMDELIAIGLTQRPELASQQALVRATLERLRTEKWRPLIPSVLVRGTSTNPAGTLGAGYFGGGRNDRVADFSGRFDYDVQILWELQNLGFGNRALVKGRQAENQLAMIELLRVQDRIAAEVVKAHAQVKSAAERLTDAEAGVKDALDSAKKHLDGMAQTQPIGKSLVLVIRPQEVQAAIQALAQAYADYYAALADYDRGQFRLWRALGNPGAACAAP